MREEDGPAWVAHGDNGGSLVDLHNAKTGRFPDHPYWYRVFGTFPMIMAGKEKGVCVEEVTAFMDGTELAVAGGKGRRRAWLGTLKTYRLNANQPFYMNDDKPRMKETQGRLTSWPGRNRCVASTSFGDLDGNGSIDWLDGAKLLRRRMPKIPTHFYDDKFLYMIQAAFPQLSGPRTTFEQAKKLIHDVAALMDEWPQVAYYGGCYYDGNDSGYPANDVVNEKIGGYEGMMRLMERGPKHNCTVSFTETTTTLMVGSVRCKIQSGSRRHRSAAGWADDASFSRLETATLPTRSAWPST